MAKENHITVVVGCRKGQRHHLFENFWDPLNICGSDDAALFKFGVHMDPRLFLPAHYKLAAKWACPVARDPVLKL